VTTNYTWPFTNTADQNAACTGAGAPFPCCSGSDAGTCANYNCDGSGTSGPNAVCTTSGSPFSCCSGLGTGSCSENEQPCCTGLHAGTCGNSLLASANITLFANVGVTAVEDSTANTGDSATVITPSTATTEADTLNVGVCSIYGDNSVGVAIGQTISWEHNIAGTGPDASLSSISAVNSSCTASGNPFSCCTSLGHGTCGAVVTPRNWECDDNTTAGDWVGFQINLSPLP
jgi:hypothetical protein